MSTNLELLKKQLEAQLAAVQNQIISGKTSKVKKNLTPEEIEAEKLKADFKKQLENIGQYTYRPHPLERYVLPAKAETLAKWMLIKENLKDAKKCVELTGYTMNVARQIICALQQYQLSIDTNRRTEAGDLTDLGKQELEAHKLAEAARKLTQAEKAEAFRKANMQKAA